MPEKTPAKAAPNAQPPAEEVQGEVLESTGTLENVLQSLTRAFEAFVGAARTPADLSAYRSVNAARGLQECQALLDQGWDIIHSDYCEEVRRRGGVGKQASVLAWTPYFIMGRRDTMVSQDRAAILLFENQRAMASGVPVADDEAAADPEQAAGDGASPAQPADHMDPARPRGRVVTAAGPRSIGAEGMGALRGR